MALPYFLDLLLKIRGRAAAEKPKVLSLQEVPALEKVDKLPVSPRAALLVPQPHFLSFPLSRWEPFGKHLWHLEGGEVLQAAGDVPARMPALCARSPHSRGSLCLPAHTPSYPSDSGQVQPSWGRRERRKETGRHPKKRSPGHKPPRLPLPHSPCLTHAHGLAEASGRLPCRESRSS